MVEKIKSPAERKVLLSNVSWETYESLLEDHESSSVPRFTYDQGEMEIMSPSPEHEAYNRSIALLVEFAAEELSIDVYDLGSTTSGVRTSNGASSRTPVSTFRTRNGFAVRTG